VTLLVKRLFSDCSFPSILKKAEVSPIFKKENKMDKTKYRPISILPCISLVVEKIVNTQITSYFQNILNSNVSAYRKCYNTQYVVLKAVEDWKMSLDANKVAGGICIDLSKAFDVIPHGLLLSKLYAYGCNLNTVNFFYNYLSNRSQRVKVDNERSPWMPIVKGVPQGSVLGPAMFNIFVNDIFSAVKHCSIYNYADDNVLSYAADNIATLKEVLDLM
jgi:hypothetical protein